MLETAIDLPEQTQTEEELKQLEKEEKNRKKASEVLKSVDHCNFSTLEFKIAWILNHYPDSRNSDIACQLKYWHTFQSELFNLNSGSINIENYKKLMPLGSITRPRATIQNTYKLFLADEQVRKYRGTLSKELREDAIKSKRSIEKSYIVYADESGKTDKYLLVGSMWILDGIDTAKITMAIDKWRGKHGFDSEIHFKQINKGNIDKYLDLISVIKNNSSALSFKALGLERQGIRNINESLTSMFYHLLADGVKHENESGRAELPRKINFWKDEEEIGSDRLMLMKIKNDLEVYSSTVFNGDLDVKEFEAISSKDSIFVQIADLFTGSINRTLNVGDSGNHKDTFAKKFLAEFGITNSKSHFESIGDCAKFSNL